MYPLKYAIKKIYERTFVGYHESEELYEYKATECYLAAEHKSYHENRDSEIKYEVSFPRINNSNKEVFCVDVNFDGEFYHTMLVDNVYDSLEEAQLIEKKMNDELKMNYSWIASFGNDK